VAEIWIVGVAAPTSVARFAERCEADGFTGLAVVDSQNLSGDPYVALAMAARATSTLGLATGVTNPYTRHPAATASSIASVQAISGGRAVLGIGRGDSALAHLGLSPAPVRLFEDYLRRLQGYLRGEDVPFDETSGIESMDALGLGEQPTSSRLHWVGTVPKVPVDVAASGPRVIGVAGSVGDRVTLAVGADPERVAWGIDLARQARAAAGLDPATLGLGCYVNVAVHDDLDVARRLVAGGLTTLARFNVMHGSTHGPTSEDDRAVLADLHDRYDMTKHTQPGSAQAGALTADFVDRFAAVGPPDAVIGRLRSLIDLGVGKLVLLGAGRAPGLEQESRDAHRRFVADVLPALA
jgi:5,10-methylenetetrahydromethanopterin reductase